MIYRLTSSILLSLILATSSLASGILSTDQYTAIVTACQQLVYDYAYYRDQNDAEKWANVFSKDGVFNMGGMSEFKGRETLAQHVIDDPNSAKIHRHMMTTVRITPIDEKSATGISYVMVLGGAASNTDTLPTPLGGIDVMVEYHDKFSLTDEGWKIANREAKLVFITPPKKP